MEYAVLRDCWVGERLYKKGELYELPDEVDKDPRNFREVGVGAELHDEIQNDEYEAQLKVKNKPEHIPAGWYWCTECQRTHNGNRLATGKINKLAKRHLKYRA